MDLAGRLGRLHGLGLPLGLWDALPAHPSESGGGFIPFYLAHDLDNALESPGCQGKAVESRSSRPTENKPAQPIDNRADGALYWFSKHRGHMSAGNRNTPDETQAAQPEACGAFSPSLLALPVHLTDGQSAPNVGALGQDEGKAAYLYPLKTASLRTPMPERQRFSTANRGLTLTERFWEKVQRGGPEECWPWVASHDGHGYGKIGVGGRSGREIKAHRLAWILINGEIPVGLGVLHRCDNPPCCNPAHLFVGTHAENLADAHAKGRIRASRALGMANGRSKLTPERVTAIKALLGSGMNLCAIARRSGVSRGCIARIKDGTTWRHVS